MRGRGLIFAWIIQDNTLCLYLIFTLVFPVLVWPDAGRAASVGDNEEGERMEVADMIQPSR